MPNPLVFDPSTPQGTPFGFAGSQFDRPVYNQQFFQQTPETRLNTLQQFQSGGGQLSPEDETIMRLLSQRVQNQQALQQQAPQQQAPQQQQGGLLSQLFQALSAANPFDVAGGAMEGAREENRRNQQQLQRR